MVQNSTLLPNLSRHCHHLHGISFEYAKFKNYSVMEIFIEITKEAMQCETVWDCLKVALRRPYVMFCGRYLKSTEDIIIRVITGTGDVCWHLACTFLLHYTIEFCADEFWERNGRQELERAWGMELSILLSYDSFLSVSSNTYWLNKLIGYIRKFLQMHTRWFDQYHNSITPTPLFSTLHACPSLPLEITLSVSFPWCLLKTIFLTSFPLSLLCLVTPHHLSHPDFLSFLSLISKQSGFEGIIIK